jgi:hypothetical protein
MVLPTEAASKAQTFSVWPRRVKSGSSLFPDPKAKTFITLSWPPAATYPIRQRNIKFQIGPNDGITLPRGALAEAGKKTIELTYLVPALKTAEGEKAEEDVGRFQEIADESREAERTRFSEGEATSRT